MGAINREKALKNLAKRKFALGRLGKRLVLDSIGQLGADLQNDKNKKSRGADEDVEAKELLLQGDHFTVKPWSSARRP